MEPFITLHKVRPYISPSFLLDPVSWQIGTGEIWALTGANGSGKTTLVRAVAGELFLREGSIRYHFAEASDTGAFPENRIRTVSFTSAYALADFRSTYYQQRFNSSDADSAPKVIHLVDPQKLDVPWLKKVASQMDFNRMAGKRLIHLSSGEMRKLLILQSLLSFPRMIIFDNPFIGLDSPSRDHLDAVFRYLAKQGIQMLFLAPSLRDIPKCTTHGAEMKNGKLIVPNRASIPIPTDVPVIPANRPEVDWTLLPLACIDDHQEIIRMENVAIRYGEQTICSHIHWIVNRGDKWALLGKNGSGKSTLLSYVFADSPQAYAQQIWLFGRKRGTGESIWDIKKRIGFTSSEMHLYYRQDVTCLEVVESGFFDHIGLHAACSAQQTAIASYLLEMLEMIKLGERSFLKVSTGEQRMVLFARALVKNPELLILDEPFQGMDATNRLRCMALMESYCRQPGKTLIYVTHYREDIPPCVTKQFILPEKYV